MGVHPEKLPSALEGVFLMGRKPKYSIEEKIKAVEDVLIRKRFVKKCMMFWLFMPLKEDLLRKERNFILLTTRMFSIRQLLKN